MVIVQTKESTGIKGPRLLLDLRNDLVYIYSSEETWDKVPLKSAINGIIPGQLLGIKDTLGILEGLVVVGEPQHYRGPHPEGQVRCYCGAKTNDSGFCPRCHDDQCHICDRPLTITKVPSGEGLPPRQIKLCKDPTHNPLPIPHWVTEPVKGEPLPKAKPHSWPNKFKELTRDQKVTINNFFDNLMGIDRLDQSNWQDECSIHNMPKFTRSFPAIKGLYEKSGPLR